MVRRVLWTSLAAVLVTVAGLSLTAQAPAPPKADAEFARAAYGTYRSMLQSSPHRSLAWQYLGPTNISGRATDIAVADRGAARRIYAAYATSGVWKTDDDGASWQAIFENQPSTSIGDIAIAPSNPDIVWVGTGESNLFRASMPGVGVFKSTDGGRTFQHSGLTDTQTIARIVVHPTQSRHRVRRSRRARLDRQRDARRVQDHRRRSNLDEGAVPKPAHRRDRSRDGSRRIPTRCTRRCGSASAASGAIRESSPDTTRAASEDAPTAAQTWSDASAGLPRAQFRGRIGIDVSQSNPDGAVRVRRQLRGGPSSA